MTWLPPKLKTKWPELYSKIESLFETNDEKDVNIDDFVQLCEDHIINNQKENNNFKIQLTVPKLNENQK